MLIRLPTRHVASVVRMDFAKGLQWTAWAIRLGHSPSGRRSARWLDKRCAVVRSQLAGSILIRVGSLIGIVGDQSLHRTQSRG